MESSLPSFKNKIDVYGIIINDVFNDIAKNPYDFVK